MKKMRAVSQRGMEAIELFTRSLIGKNLNSRTIQEYTADLKHFIGWYEYQGMDTHHNVTIFSFDQISAIELETYLQAMKDVNLKASTINRRLSTIKLLFDWAYANGFSHRNLAKHIKLVPHEKSPPRIVNFDEKKRLLHAVKTYGSLRDHAILELIIHAGLRVGEICKLKPSDVNITQRNSFIAVGIEEYRRSIPLDITCKSILQKYMSTIKSTNTYLFLSEKTGDQLTERALRHLIKKYMDIAKLEGLSAFSLRRCFNCESGRRFYQRESPK